MTKESPEPFIVINFPNNPIPFSSIETLEVWAKEELKFWEPKSELNSGNNAIRGLYEQTTNRLTSLVNHLGSIDAKRRKTPKSELETLNSHADNLAKRGFKMASSDERVHYAVNQCDSKIAAWVLAAFETPEALLTDNRSKNMTLPAVQALIAVNDFRYRNLEDAIESKLSAVESTKHRLDEMEQDAAAKNNRIFERQNELVASLEDAKKTHTEQQEELFNKSKTELQAIENAFSVGFGLEAPVTYWTSKVNLQKKLAKNYGIAFGILLAVVIGLMAWLIWSFNDELKSKDTAYWALAIILSTGALLIWPLRILSKNLMSNLHLSSDAEERVVMLKTYLSLLRSSNLSVEQSTSGDGKEITPDEMTRIKNEHIQVILDSLFRSSQTGIVRDDGAPPSVMTAISKMFDGR